MARAVRLGRLVLLGGRIARGGTRAHLATAIVVIVVVVVVVGAGFLRATVSRMPLSDLAEFMLRVYIAQQ